MLNPNVPGPLLSARTSQSPVQNKKIALAFAAQYFRDGKSSLNSI